VAEHFPLPLRVEFRDHGRSAVLLESFIFQDGDLFVAVHAGFVTDFNSTPRLLWWWFPPTEHPEAAVIHDHLYQYPGELTREQCDRVHWRILGLNGMRDSKRNLAYLGIRAGGWVPWNRYRQGEIA
jgi:hypothetical protein